MATGTPGQRGFESQVGLNWVNRVAVITLIFGAAFFFKYAVDNDWVGPGGRVAIGVIAAIAALLAGDRLWKRGHKIFAQGLTGLGLALLYLSFYATFSLYHLLPQAAAFLLMMVTTGAAGVFALRYESQAIAILGLLGGYLTPLALSTGEDRPWTLFSYIFLLNLGAAALARVRRWTAVLGIALAATSLIFGLWVTSKIRDDTRTVATVFAIAFYAQFAASESRVVWGFAQVLASLGAAVIWEDRSGFLLLALLFAAGGLPCAELRRKAEGPPWTLLCYSIAYWVWTGLSRMGAPTTDRLVTFAALSAGFLMFFAWTLWWVAVSRRVVREAELFVLAANGASYFAASYILLNPVYHAYMGLFAAALGGIHIFAARLLWKPETSEKAASWPALLAVAITVSFLTLAIPIQFTGFRITMAWALEGAVLAWLAARFETGRLHAGAWLVFALVVSRLFAFDSWIYTNGKQFEAVVNGRFVTFAVVAISLWLAAKFTKTPAIAAAAEYVTGHFVMLWILGMEVIGWVERSIPEPDHWNVETTAISVLMALYAVGLVAIGVTTPTVLNRVLGLGLIGIVVLKLYLMDVWSLGLGFRITAFLGLGGLLLMMSFLYSRYKRTVEKLWKDDPNA